MDKLRFTLLTKHDELEYHFEQKLIFTYNSKFGLLLQYEGKEHYMDIDLLLSPKNPLYFVRHGGKLFI